MSFQLDYTGIQINEALKKIIDGTYESQIGALSTQVTDMSGVIKGNVIIENINKTTSIPVVHVEYLNSTATGKLIIKLPVGFQNAMVRFTIEITEKYGVSLGEYHIAGQLYSGSNNWGTNAQAYSDGIGSKMGIAVAFGNVEDRACITIGDISTSWNGGTYVKIKDLTVAFADNTVDAWKKGWEVSVGTISGNFNKTITDSLKYEILRLDEDNVEIKADSFKTMNFSLQEYIDQGYQILGTVGYNITSATVGGQSSSYISVYGSYITDDRKTYSVKLRCNTKTSTAKIRVVIKLLAIRP